MTLANEGLEAQKKDEEISARKRKKEAEKNWEGQSISDDNAGVSCSYRQITDFLNRTFASLLSTENRDARVSPGLHLFRLLSPVAKVLHRFAALTKILSLLSGERLAVILVKTEEEGQDERPRLRTPAFRIRLSYIVVLGGSPLCTTTYDLMTIIRPAPINLAVSWTLVP